MYGPGRVRAQTVTRIVLRPGLSMELGDSSVCDLTQDLPVTLIKSKTMSRARAPSVIRSGSRAGGVI